ncbi:small subunit ribosomal protein S16 [Entomortierella parvispora]|uniref:Small subunit ribosomal protein S16 n=1 Tax=Entomortierella parvispora TaxID=205924 RepID=A0A9P3HCD4_9FUNG|nr:small subunit ribosomal protein S16 [Entomortierella parvispora]
MLSIKLARHGVKNTPFFHIVVLQSRSRPTRKPIEQLGTFNPIPDKEGNKAISLNFERAKYWISVGAKPSDTVARILAKADIIPAQPRPGMPNPSRSIPVKEATAPTTPSA